MNKDKCRLDLCVSGVFDLGTPSYLGDGRLFVVERDEVMRGEGDARRRDGMSYAVALRLAVF